jgi:hypothetical protein
VSTDNPFDAALQLAGDFAWTLVSPDGTQTSYEPVSSSLSAFSDYLIHGRTGDATGQVCFTDPTGSGQFAVTWQPRLLEAERVVWIVRLP